MYLIDFKTITINFKWFIVRLGFFLFLIVFFRPISIFIFFSAKLIYLFWEKFIYSGKNRFSIVFFLSNLDFYRFDSLSIFFSAKYRFQLFFRPNIDFLMVNIDFQLFFSANLDFQLMLSLAGLPRIPSKINKFTGFSPIENFP